MVKGNKNTICPMLKYGKTFYGCHTALNTSFIRKWGTRELEEKLPMSIRATYAIQYFTCDVLNPVGIQHKSIAGRYRPVRVADGPITARYRFIINASWESV